jgi:transposase
MTEVGCWAHARRYFFEAQTTEPGLSKEMLERIGAFYGVEKEAKELELSPADRCSLRKDKSSSLLLGIKEWLDVQKSRVLPKSPIGQAIEYALNQWQALNRYLEDGRLSIDNNACERAIRAVAIGRKNWMFAGSHEGAKRAALMFSLIGSCKLLHIDPFAYLCDVIERISGHPASKIAELTPAGWKKMQIIPPTES